MRTDLVIDALNEDDPPVIAAAFAAADLDKPASLYAWYLVEQAAQQREVLVARLDGVFAGYVTINWRADYPPFRDAGIPEIQDFNVLPQFRRHGVGTALMDQAEAVIAARSGEAGIGVGLHPGYGAAQRLYVLRGYVPDGRGVAWNRATVAPMQTVAVDDNLALYSTKTLD